MSSGTRGWRMPPGLSLSHTHTCFSLSHTDTLLLTHSLTKPCILKLTHTHTHTHTHTLTVRTLSLSLSQDVLWRTQCKRNVLCPGTTPPQNGTWTRNFEGDLIQPCTYIHYSDSLHTLTHSHTHCRLSLSLSLTYTHTLSLTGIRA